MFISSIGFGQSMHQVMRGTVKDNISEMPIPGVKLIILNTNPVMGAITDYDGLFTFNKVPVGRHDVVITAFGYEDLVLKGVSLEAGKEKVLIIAMVEKVVVHDGVDIVANSHEPNNDMSVVSTQKFTVEETQKFAAAVNDPARMATSFAGVVSTEGVNNDISIRGNSPRGLIWRMEGVDIPNPNHFADVGTSGGGISIISAQLLGNSDFSTGAFAAEYGNALSGVFDLSLRKGNNQKREYTFQAGVLGIDAAMEGPIKKAYRGSYLVNYRYSTLGLLGQIVPIGDEVTTFQDLSFNVFLPTKNIGNFGVFGFGGLSSAIYKAEEDTSVWSLDPGKQYEGTFKANTGTVGAWHKLRIGKKAMLRTNIAVSGIQNVDFGDSLDYGFKKHREYDDNFVQSRLTLSTVYTQKVSSKLNFKSGIVFNQIGFSIIKKDDENGALFTRIEQDGSTQNMQVYGQGSYRFTEKLTLNMGLHYLQLFLNNSNNLEPRAALSYKLNNKHMLSIGYGSHSQIQPLGSYFARVENSFGEIIQPNRKLDLSKAQHAVLSYNWMLDNTHRLKAEVYYQHLYNIPVGANKESSFSMLNSPDGFISTELVSNGLGKNYGLELSFDRSLKNNFYYLVAASIYESKYKANNDLWYDTRYNTKFSFNLTGGKEWVLKNEEKRRTLGVNIKSVYAGGLRYTPFDLENYNGLGYPSLDTDRSFEKAMPNYYRLDFKISLKRDYKNVTGTISLDLQNVLNVKNVGGYYFDIAKGRIEFWYNPGILPILSYRLNF